MHIARHMESHRGLVDGHRLSSGVYMASLLAILLWPLGLVGAALTSEWALLAATTGAAVTGSTVILGLAALGFWTDNDRLRQG